MCFLIWIRVSFWFLVIFSHVNQWQSFKWANNNKVLILNSHFRLRKLRLSYQGTKNVVIYAFSSGKIQNVIKIACVKNMTNIMSGFILWIIDQLPLWVFPHWWCGCRSKWGHGHEPRSCLWWMMFIIKILPNIKIVTGWMDTCNVFHQNFAKY